MNELLDYTISNPNRKTIWSQTKKIWRKTTSHCQVQHHSQQTKLDGLQSTNLQLKPLNRSERVVQKYSFSLNNPPLIWGSGLWPYISHTNMKKPKSTLYNLQSTLYTLQSTQYLSKLLFWTRNAKILDNNETEDIEKYWWRGKPKYK